MFLPLPPRSVPGPGAAFSPAFTHTSSPLGGGGGPLPLGGADVDAAGGGGSVSAATAATSNNNNDDVRRAVPACGGAMPRTKRKSSGRYLNLGLQYFKVYRITVCIVVVVHNVLYK